MRYGPEALLLEAHIDNVVTVCYPGGRPRKYDIIYISVFALEDVPI